MAGAQASVDPETLRKFQQTMDRVYGAADSANAGGWKPKALRGGSPRYLWTDAFGVCNYLTLHDVSGDAKYLEQADKLIDEVHTVLGRDRDGSTRLGAATDDQPLLGGLRIGKSDPEGHPDGDGQYFHYLTKWMFALNRMALAKREPHYTELAIQLAKSIHPHFVHRRGASSLPHIYWKTTIDMSRPAVPSEGNLDPFDGYTTYRLLQAGPREGGAKQTSLDAEIADMEAMVLARYRRYGSSDPLDLGEALWLSHWWAPEEEWAKVVTMASLGALGQLWAGGAFTQVAGWGRLAFREFGTTLGVQVSPAAGAAWHDRVAQLHQTWESGGRMWQRDQDISPVMYCASLIPGVWDRRWAPKKQQRSGRQAEAQLRDNT